MKSVTINLTLAIIVAACASGAPGSSGGSRDVITLEEIQPVQVANAFELIQRLRPEMLRSRTGAGMSGTAGSTPVVYLDGVRNGEVNQLYGIPKELVREIRYINAADATTRFGTGHTGGAILILSRRGRDG